MSDHEFRREAPRGNNHERSYSERRRYGTRIAVVLCWAVFVGGLLYLLLRRHR